jgi:predicted RNA binding protein YcfA (HicA-like mRNA interferase family)
MGFAPRPRTASSHEKWVKTTGAQRWVVTVDCPKQPFGPDLISSMARQAGVSKADFYRAALE